MSLLILAVCVPAISGFFVGRYVERQDHLISELAEKSPAASDVETKVGAPKSPKPEQAMLPSDLAKAKNVPAKVSGAEGEYTLVSVIEGVEMNQQMTDNLQIVTAKRQKLEAAAKQYEQTPAGSVQQRELLASQINEMRNTLVRDLRVLEQGYAYSLNNTYVRVPHVVTLSSVAQADGKNTTKLVHRFATSADYLEFQQKNDAYQRMKLEAGKAQATASKGEAQQPNKNKMPLPKGVVPAKPSPAEAVVPVKAVPQIAQIKALRAELIKTYQFDPEQRYLLQFEKTALYARPVK